MALPDGRGRGLFGPHGGGTGLNIMGRYNDSLHDLPLFPRREIAPRMERYIAYHIPLSIAKGIIFRIYFTYHYLYPLRIIVI